MNLTPWDIDLESGHIAHPSGLHAYIASEPESCGAIRCIGPFSSYKNALKRRDVLRFTVEAIHAIEALEPFRDCFTYWGSLATSGSHTDNTITVLGERFGFIPNPCFRSDLLLSTPVLRASSYDLSREWNYDGIRPQIEHRLGYKFHFPPDQERRSCIGAEVTAVSDDNSDIRSELRPLILRTLGSLAVAVLGELGHQFAHSGARKLKLRFQEELA